MRRRVHPMSLYANGLRAQHHISGKTTFRILCAGAHKMREIRTFGLMSGIWKRQIWSAIQTPTCRKGRQTVYAAPNNSTAPDLDSQLRLVLVLGVVLVLEIFNLISGR